MECGAVVAGAQSALQEAEGVRGYLKRLVFLRRLGGLDLCPYLRPLQ